MKPGPKPKTLLEHFEDHSFRWDRHRALLRDDLQLAPEEIPLVIELDSDGYSSKQIAARFRLPVGVIKGALALYKRVGA